MKRKVIALMITTLVGAEGAKATQKTVVPAFFLMEQNTNGLTPDWTRIANQSSSILAVVPLGGPGGLETATGTELSNARSTFTTIWNSGNGAMVLGYVDAGFACTATGNLTTTLTNLKTGGFGVSQWYSTPEYPTQIQGIFLDEGPQLATCECPNCDLHGQAPQPETTQQTYYSQAYNYVGTNYSGAKVMLNASQFENSWIIAAGSNKSSDFAVIFEKEYSTWYNSYKAEDNSNPTWWTTGYQGLLANVIYNTTQYDITDGVSHSQGSTYGSPVLYFYDGSSQSYDHLSCAFETQVALLQGTTPVPAATTYCGGTCKDFNSDVNDCGSCGNVCPGTAHGGPVAAMAHVVLFALAAITPATVPRASPTLISASYLLS